MQVFFPCLFVADLSLGSGWIIVFLLISCWFSSTYTCCHCAVVLLPTETLIYQQMNNTSPATVFGINYTGMSQWKQCVSGGFFTRWEDVPSFTWVFHLLYAFEVRYCTCSCVTQGLFFLYLWCKLKLRPFSYCHVHQDTRTPCWMPGYLTQHIGWWDCATDSAPTQKCCMFSICSVDMQRTSDKSSWAEYSLHINVPLIKQATEHECLYAL